MSSRQLDTVIIGGGPAGIGAAIRAWEKGLRTLLLENSERIGGIPLQCIHPGFGIHYLKEDLTGTEFIQRLVDMLDAAGVEYWVKSHVYSVKNLGNGVKEVQVITPRGIEKLRTKTVIFATGARERHLSETGIVGDRVDGVYTAGEAQALMDIYGVMPGKEVVIVGSGDVGMIVARRLALEGASVKAVVELLPYPGGLMRNYVQCIRDFNIPLLTSHAVIEIRGKERVEKVVVAKVDEDMRPIKGTEFEIECDTVILATGLIPNTSILEEMGAQIDPATRGPVVNDYLETTIPGVFAAGNVLLINDLVDYAVEQGVEAAEGAYAYVSDTIRRANIPVVKGRNIRLVVPQVISGKKDFYLYARVAKPERDVVFNIPEISLSMRKSVVRPSEMIRIRIPKRLLDRAGSLEKLTVQVVPA